MTKKEFLDILYEQLSDQLSSDTAFAHTQYYRNYIEAEIQKGKSEQEILLALGDPRLIAKTLIDTEAEPSAFSNSQPHPDTASQSEERRSDSKKQHRQFHLDLSTWYGKALVILAAAGVLALLFMLFSFLLPFLLVIFLLTFLITQFHKKR